MFWVSAKFCFIEKRASLPFAEIPYFISSIFVRKFITINFLVSFLFLAEYFNISRAYLHYLKVMYLWICLFANMCALPPNKHMECLHGHLHTWVAKNLSFSTHVFSAKMNKLLILTLLFQVSCCELVSLLWSNAPHFYILVLFCW